MSRPVRSIELFFQEGTSDKVYHAQIVEDAGAYSVHCQWGRRGAALQQGSKAVRVPLAQAQRKFDALVREKTAKGYQQVTADVQPAAVAPPEGHGSGSRVIGTRAKVGIAAQLQQAIDSEAELARLLANDGVVAQQKLDGQRVLVHVQDGAALLVTNRDGQRTAVDPRRFAGLAYVPQGTILDGELLDDAYWAFDVLAFAGDDVRGRGYLERFAILDGEIEPALTGDVRILPVATGKRAKQRLHDQLRAANAEGLVFKDREAPYTSGRSAAQRKYKFLKSADVVILENAGNAYLMAVYDGTQLFEVGKVFAGTTNASRRALDAALARGERPVCEVRYLYATADHQLYQPVFVTARTDKPATDCLRAQLVTTSRSVVVVV